MDAASGADVSDSPTAGEGSCRECKGAGRWDRSGLVKMACPRCTGTGKEPRGEARDGGEGGGSRRGPTGAPGFGVAQPVPSGPATQSTTDPSAPRGETESPWAEKESPWCPECGGTGRSGQQEHHRGCGTDSGECNCGGVEVQCDCAGTGLSPRVQVCLDALRGVPDPAKLLAAAAAMFEEIEAVGSVANGTFDAYRSARRSQEDMG